MEEMQSTDAQQALADEGVMRKQEAETRSAEVAAGVSSEAPASEETAPAEA